MREKMLDGVFPLRNKEKIVVYHEIGGRKQMEGTMENGKMKDFGRSVMTDK